MSCPPDQRVQGCWEHMIQISKKLLRDRLKKKRHALLDDEALSLSRSISKRLVNEPDFENCNNLAIYMASNKETLLLITKNKKILLPKIESNKLTFHLHTNKFKKNKFGIREPLEKEVFPINKIQLILVPLIAFNADLYRIGYGGGYYDRTLQNFVSKKTGPKLWGIGYDFQRVSTNFQNKFDIRLDKVITDKKIYV